MLEISGTDIASLNDEDLRSLVGMLCEAELKSGGRPVSAVTWGGNQNAADGGIDVRVRIEVGEAPGGFLPRASIGFQVKQTDFTPGLISAEMRPSGQLRPSIGALIEEHGAYIIASSGSDTSDTALENRLRAMRSAIADHVGQLDLHVDFYDRNRLATWTRSHPGLVLWVRQKIGRGESGWQPYGPWAVSPAGVKDEYLLDDKVRLHTSAADEHGVDIAHGIDRMRNILRDPRGVIRLTGLSGVGKTRLVQSLFDRRVGNNSLNPASVIYADMNDNPSPQPTGMLFGLIALRTRGVVVVDNCAPDLHRRLTEVCRSPESEISAITIEYDVQEDEPEGTEVFRLEPSSLELVSKLIARRFPHLTRLDVDKIADFSGGNARVALALASTLERHESVAGLQDEELFKRLFHQRQAHDDGLLVAAQACALLYSFQGEAIIGNDAELSKIGALVGMSAQQLFAKVAQLKQRDLVQRRGVWRAVLPHAIANRLARMALREIPSEIIERHFDTERLMRSFSRRIGYLHESAEATRVVERWLGKDGLLANVWRLSDFGFAMFNNVAPVAPEVALRAIESGLPSAIADGLLEQRNGGRVGSVLRSIAYDASLFERSIAAMIPLALNEPDNAGHQPIAAGLESLFHIFLSGTHATVEQRTRVAVSLIRSTEPKRRALGARLFEALLKAEHFSGTHSFEFGARIRDYGYWPRTRAEKVHWYSTVLGATQSLVSTDDVISRRLRSAVARSIQSIWFLGSEVEEQLGVIATEINKTEYWKEGWIAVRSTLSHLSAKIDVVATNRLRDFERALHPKNVVDRVHAVVLSQNWGDFDYADIEDDDGVDAKGAMAAYEKANLIAENLGREVARDRLALQRLLPDLVICNAGRAGQFGKGLALGSIDRDTLWRDLSGAFAQAEPGERNAAILNGFLIGAHEIDRQFAESLLDEALTDAALGAWLPILQCAIPISKAGVDRLKLSLESGVTESFAFRSLAYGRSSDAIGGEDLRAIVLGLARREGGFEVSIDILAMRFHSDRDQKREPEPELLDAGRQLLSSPVLNGRDNMHGHRLCIIANICLRGEAGRLPAQGLCTRLKEGFADYTFHAFDHEQLLECIFKVQPRVALDAFFGHAADSGAPRLDVDDFDDPSDRRKNPIDALPNDEILRWCEEYPSDRYLRMSRVVSFHVIQEREVMKWTPLALEMLKRAPDPIAILETFVDRFSPTSWSGSRAAIVQSRFGLLDQLGELGNAAISEHVELVRPKLAAQIVEMRKWEDKRDSEYDERFE
ncbi:MAG: hypothetical protein ACTHLO_14670 [Pseudolabrys sp.]